MRLISSEIDLVHGLNALHDAHKAEGNDGQLESSQPPLFKTEVLASLSRQRRRRRLFEGAMKAVNDRNLKRFSLPKLSGNGFAGMRRAQRRNLARAYAKAAARDVTNSSRQ